MTESILQYDDEYYDPGDAFADDEMDERDFDADEFTTVSLDNVTDKPTQGVNAYGVPYTLEPMEQLQQGIRLARRANRRELQKRYLKYFHPLLLENPELAPAFCDDLCTGHALVDAIGALQIQGMIFDNNWIGSPLMQTTPGSTNFTVLLVWTWIVDRYRPQKVKNSDTGAAKYFLKFSGTDYTTTYARLARELGMTSRKAEAAIKFLERQGMIGRRAAPEARSEGKGNEKPFAVWPLPDMVRMVTGRGNVTSVQLSESTGNPIADQLAQINFFGNVIDYTWLDHPAFDDETNKGLMLIVFAELYFLHTPSPRTDPFSHCETRRAKKFDGDVMYKSYRLWSQKTGLSLDQLRRALTALAKAGLINKWRAPVYDRMGEPTNNKILIELIFDKVLEVTYGTCEAMPRSDWTPAQIKALETASKQMLNVQGQRFAGSKVPTKIAQTTMQKPSRVETRAKTPYENCADHTPGSADHTPGSADHTPGSADHTPGSADVHSEYISISQSKQNQQQQPTAAAKIPAHKIKATDAESSSVVVVPSKQKTLSQALPGTACISVTAAPPSIGPSAELRDALNVAGLAIAEIDNTFQVAVGHWGERAEAELWDQIAELPRRNPREPGAMLRTAIVKGYATPHAKAARQAREEAAKSQEAQDAARREREASEARQRAQQARQQVATAALDAAYANLPAEQRAEIDAAIWRDKPVLRGRESSAAMAVARRAAVSDIFESLTDDEAQAETLASMTLASMQQPDNPPANPSSTKGFAALGQLLPEPVLHPNHNKRHEMNRREIERVLSMAQQRLVNDPLADDIAMARDTLGSELDDDEWEIVIGQLRRAA